MNNLIQHNNISNMPWQLLAYSLLGIIVGILLVLVPLLQGIVFIAGIILLIAGVKRPEYVVLTIVILTSSIIFEAKLPLIPIGIGSLHIADTLLLFLFGIIGYRAICSNTTLSEISPINKLLWLFMGTVIISAVISVYTYGVDISFVFRRLREVSYYLLFYLITSLVTEKRQIQFLIRGLFCIAMVVAVTMLVQAVVGESIQLMPGRVEVASTFGEEFDATRILPPGTTLVLVLLIMSICFVTFIKERSILKSGQFYIFMVLGIGIVLTYTRSYWITVLLAISLLLLIPSVKYKLRLLAMLAIVAILATTLITTFANFDKRFENTLFAVSARVSSLFAGKDLTQSSSLESRQIENSYAIPLIERHPVLGIGLGNDYRPPIFGDNDTITYYIHNGYLWILTDMGILGLVSFMLFYGGFLIRAVRNWNNIGDIYLKTAIVSFVLSGIGILLMSLYVPLFMEWHSIVVIATIMGLSETIIRYNLKAAGSRTCQHKNNSERCLRRE